MSTLLWFAFGTPWLFVVAVCLFILAVLGAVVLRLPWGLAFGAFGVAAVLLTGNILRKEGYDQAIEDGRRAGALRDASVAKTIETEDQQRLSALTEDRLKDQERINDLATRLAKAQSDCGLSVDDIGSMPTQRRTRP